jgi:hypothetical protein
MKTLDRLLILTLVVGVWALVLKPSNINAHDDRYLTCSISGSASGYADGDYVEVDDFGSASVDCY